PADGRRPRTAGRCSRAVVARASPACGRLRDVPWLLRPLAAMGVVTAVIAALGAGTAASPPASAVPGYGRSSGGSVPPVHAASPVPAVPAVPASAHVPSAPPTTGVRPGGVRATGVRPGGVR